MSEPIWHLVIKDMLARNEMGAVKYNKYLQKNTGEDMLLHAYEEALDLAVYLKTLIEKRGDMIRRSELDPTPLTHEAYIYEA